MLLSLRLIVTFLLLSWWRIDNYVVALLPSSSLPFITSISRYQNTNHPFLATTTSDTTASSSTTATTTTITTTTSTSVSTTTETTVSSHTNNNNNINNNNNNNSGNNSNNNKNNRFSDGISKSFQRLLSRTKSTDRQRFVTGQYPVTITLEENNPTLKWLQLGKATKTSTTVLLVNGTSIDQSLASLDRYQWWLDDTERHELHDRYATVSMELLAEISIEKPGYIQILPSHGPGRSAATNRRLQQLHGTTTITRWNQQFGKKSPLLQQQQQQQDSSSSTSSTTTNNSNNNIPPSSSGERLWVTGFSLASRHGYIHTLDVHDGRIDSINKRSRSMMLWPNEVQPVPANLLSSQTQLINQHHQYHQQQQYSTTSIQQKDLQDAVLVSDGFLVPGKDRGGIYLVNHPSNTNKEWTVCLTDPLEREPWFYHRAVWVDLTGDGRQSILTARAKLLVRTTTTTKTTTTSTTSTSSQTRTTTSDRSSRISPTTDLSSNVHHSEAYYNDSSRHDRNHRQTRRTKTKNGQLVWLEMPKPHHIDVATGTPLEKDGTAFDPFSARHLPWKEHVLDTGPDVMFAIADLDPTDDTIEVLSSQFFDKKVSLHSIQKGQSPKVVFRRDIDNQCGAAFGGILANLDDDDDHYENNIIKATIESSPRVIDSGSTVNALEHGEVFSHFLVTSHECSYDIERNNNNNNNVSGGDSGFGPSLTESRNRLSPNSKTFHSSKTGILKGGSLFAYRVPTGKDAWRTQPWLKTTVASGFQVKSQIWNVINPGAPGFCYTFHAHRDDKKQGKRPMIAVAGDCAESAYIYRPEQKDNDNNNTFLDDKGQSDDTPNSSSSTTMVDEAARYKLMCEIKCGSTVGSIAVGYEDLCGVEQESGYAKLYIPCFEKDKILAFALGSGESEVHNVADEEEEDDDNGEDDSYGNANGW
ncbi:hypothetical protein IV203_023800 [Nitzschia inconspicua]|uniref:Uncharacterized protein n=1 Tax=Nitzschia inconspicua TaxID=303405 RepID=A0A9K3PAG0_9STRA|nr:hypothetical protein IV203_023800 [Nitzschia inconspicua]